MKNVILTVVFLFAIVIASCGGDEYSCSQDDEECPNTGGTWEICCTPSADCYYKAGSKKFKCDTFDCTTAAQEINEYCYGEGATEEKLLETAKKIQEEISE